MNRLPNRRFRRATSAGCKFGATADAPVAGIATGGGRGIADCRIDLIILLGLCGGVSTVGAIAAGD